MVYEEWQTSLAHVTDLIIILYCHSYDLYRQVVKTFFPKSMQLYPNEFPGKSPNDCPRDISREKLVCVCSLLSWWHFIGQRSRSVLMQIILTVMVTIEKLQLLLLSITGGGRCVYDVCTSVCMSVCVYICMYVCLSVGVWLCVSNFVCLSGLKLGQHHWPGWSTDQDSSLGQTWIWPGCDLV